MNVFDLCAKLSLDDSEYKKGLGESEGLASKVGSTLSSTFGAVAKASVTAFAVAGGAVAGLAKQAIDSYADFEQLKGGVETLFDNTENLQAYRDALLDMGVAGSAVEEQIRAMEQPVDIVMKNASNAYKTAGLSANEYMETVTGMASALNQSTGDLEVSAKMADMAVTDMSDNANKMGSSMESIQNAYSGFAKQNYTMLDNLKLGYGGTKEEMQRLLEDAQAISGVEYDLSSYADIVDAIHVVQTDLGITGTTAKEASTTISGSLNMVKGAWKNLITGMADDDANFSELIGNMVESIGAFGDNILPRISIALEGIGEVIQQVAPIIVEQLPPLIETILPPLLDSIGVLIQGIAQALPSLITMLSNMIPMIIKTVLPVIVSSGTTILSTLAQAIIDNLPLLIETGLQIILQLAMSLADALPSLIPTIVDVVLQIVDTLIDNVDLLIDASIALIIGLAEGLANAMPKLIEKLPELVMKIVDALIANAPKLAIASLQLIIALADGLVNSWSVLLSKIPTLVKYVVDKFITFVTSWQSIGKNMVAGIWEGFKERWEKLVEDAKGLGSKLIDSLKDLLGIHSPSKVFKQIAEYCVDGFALGFQDFMDTSLLDGVQDKLYGLQKMASSGMSLDISENYTRSTEEKQNITVVLQGDADRLFRLVQEQSSKNVRLTGQPSF